MDKTIISRHLKKQWGDFANLVEKNKDKVRTGECRTFLEEAGYTTLKDGTMGMYADRDGVRFYCSRYASEYKLHVQYGFHVGNNGPENGKYIHIFGLDNNIDTVIAAGYVLPEEHYVRGADVDACIERIKKEIDCVKPLIHGFDLLGDHLYANGCLVGYDGSSICDFSKGFIHYHTHNDFPGGWHLDDTFQAYVGDDVLSRTFSLNDHPFQNMGFKLERDFEAIFGDVPTFGRQLTEKDKVGRYNRFRVRSYASKELKTLARFDTFEEARSYAFDKAKSLAESITDDRRRFTHRTPVDVSGRHDYLAAYVWYNAGRGRECMVFVQGEIE